jgi:TorA maturation chaperone TorD
MNMSEQLRMFDSELADWVKRVWRKIESEKRREIIDTLAQMGRAALSETNQSIGESKTNEL